MEPETNTVDLSVMLRLAENGQISLQSAAQLMGVDLDALRFLKDAGWEATVRSTEWDAGSAVAGLVPGVAPARVETLDEILRSL